MVGGAAIFRMAEDGGGLAGRPIEGAVRRCVDDDHNAIDRTCLPLQRLKYSVDDVNVVEGVDVGEHSHGSARR